MNDKPDQKANDAINLPCLCALIRKAGRVVTRQYDGFLKASGLRITQYSMLMNIRLNPKVTVSHLSNLLRMDQTTVTRNLKVLENLDYISIVQDPSDQRVRIISISAHGRATLEDTRASWEEAQHKVAQALGRERTRTLIDSLQRLIES